MTAEQKAEWGEDFNAIKDVDGFIRIQDLIVLFQQKGSNPTPSDEEDFRKMVDKDEDGKINLEEYMMLRQGALDMRFTQVDPTNDLIDALKEFDTNGDGTISKDELRGLLSGYDDKELEDLISAADQNGDGKLSISELAALMTAMNG
ncbi:calmodulin-like [Dreissena polymorpha]|uniref:EF-hand domain-containing protein n=1 Tax=Dreissena polymorpha TaxID=45954 RepID=A0A9D3Z4I8_DREPO|nr:calmodulin-like [Dreissena polymorpha]XP_052250519.1 calmodulin-like [Dreissena polymorpha]KAH3711712.1 hypothetical protein DPMN_071384 [Dreissena polymorpha]